MYKEPCMCGATDCERCYPGSSKGIKCDDCGERFQEDDGYEIKDVGVVCPECYDNYTGCEYCSERFHDDDIVEQDGLKYCETCFEDEIEPNKSIVQLMDEVKVMSDDIVAGSKKLIRERK